MTDDRRADNQQHYDMGLMQGRMAGLEAKVDDMSEKLSEVHDTMMQARGSWRLMLVIGGAAAAVSAVVTQFIGSFHKSSVPRWASARSSQAD